MCSSLVRYTLAELPIETDNLEDSKNYEVVPPYQFSSDDSEATEEESLATDDGCNIHQQTIFALQTFYRCRKSLSKNVYEAFCFRTKKRVALKIFVEPNRIPNEIRQREQLRRKFPEAGFIPELLDVFRYHNYVWIMSTRFRRQASIREMQADKVGIMWQFHNILRFLTQNELFHRKICIEHVLWNRVKKRLALCSFSQMTHSQDNNLDFHGTGIVLGHLLNLFRDSKEEHLMQVELHLYRQPSIRTIWEEMFLGLINPRADFKKLESFSRYIGASAAFRNMDG